jgi:hypothetical protein
MKTNPFVAAIKQHLKNTILAEDNNFKYDDGLLYKSFLYVSPIAA